LIAAPPNSNVDQAPWGQVFLSLACGTGVDDCGGWLGLDADGLLAAMNSACAAFDDQFR